MSLLKKLKIGFFAAGAISLAAMSCRDIPTGLKSSDIVCNNAYADNRSLAAIDGSIPYDTIIPLKLSTYGCQGNAVHPDVLVLPNPIKGWKKVMAITSLPSKGEKFEYPYLYVTNGWEHWAKPSDEAKNPIAFPNGDAYLSDNSIAYDFKNRIVNLNYRETGLEDKIYTMATTDLIHLTSPRVILTGKPNSLISPTESNGRMWYIKANTDRGCMPSSTIMKERKILDDRTLSQQETIDTISQPGYIIWHINIDYIEPLGLYVGLAAAYPDSIDFDCSSTNLFLITSPNGTKWTTYQNPVLKRGESKEFGDNVYESSLVYDSTNGDVIIIYSGQKNWSVGLHPAVEKMHWSSLLAKVGPPNIN